MRGCLGIFLYILFGFPMLVGTLFAVGALSWALDRDFYEDILVNDALFEAIYIAELPRYFEQEVFRTEISPEDQAYSALTIALREAVPREYLQTQVQQVVNSFFDYFDGETDTFTLLVDLTPVKDNLRGERGEAFATVLADNLPPCPTAEQQTFSETGLISCIPDDLTRQQAAGVIRDQMPAVIREIPDTVDLVQEGEAQEIDFTGNPRDGLTAAAVILIVFTAIVWLGIGALAGGNRRLFLMWLGFMLLLPGLIVLSTGVGIGNSAVDRAIRNSVEDITFEDTPNTPELRDALAETAIDAARRVASGFMTVGGIASAIAAVLIVFGLVTPPPMYASGYGVNRPGTVDVPVGMPPDGKPKNEPYHDRDYTPTDDRH
ncbi:MAG: hypothetical protein ACOCYT_01765 [Chloroflexota bacterium]